jgi:hypothetical protein
MSPFLTSIPLIKISKIGTMKFNFKIILIPILVYVITIAFSAVYAQVPAHCGYSADHACAVPDQDQAQEILEVFPDAFVIVDEEIYESIPEEDREDAEGIIEKGALVGGGEGTGSEGDILPGDKDDFVAPPQPQNNFQPLPRGQQNLPPASQSSAGLIDACLQSGYSLAQCNNMFLSGDPGGYCSTLHLAGLACPKIQDPAFTYGNPQAAEEQSRNQIERTQKAIEGFDQAVPDNLGSGFVIK